MENNTIAEVISTQRPTVEEVISTNLIPNADDIISSILSPILESEEPTEELKSITKFSDGISFVNAFKAQQETQTPMTTASLSDQKWQIWYWKRSERHYNSNKWQDFFQLKSSFTTQEEFWRSYNDINGYEFGLISSHCDYCVFKEGIKPMWEDSANRCGGRWLMEFPRKRDWKNMSYLDQIWLKVLLAITGHNLLEYRDEICGTVLMIRSRVNKIAVWTANSDKVLTNLKIGEILKSCTGYGGKMYYEAHSSTLQKSKAIEAKRSKYKI